MGGYGDFANAVKVASDGSIIMEIHEPGVLVAPFEILDAASTGKIDAGFAASGYWQAKIPAAAFFCAIPFGPEAPEGKEKNWIQTVPGKGWFTYIRFYGPLEPFFDQTWKPDDIVKVG